MCSLQLLLSGWAGLGLGLAGPLDRPAGTRVALGLLCSQRPRRPWSQALSDKSEASSMPHSVAYVSLSMDSQNYTMQEFALRYFRKPQK